MNSKHRLYRDGLVAGTSIALWMLATVGIVHTTVLVTSEWGLLYSTLAAVAAGVLIIVLGMAAASIAYLVSLRGPPGHMTGGEA